MGESQKDVDSPCLTPQELRRRVAHAREERRRREEKAALARRVLDEALEDCRRAQEVLDRETDLLLRLVEGAGPEAERHEPHPLPSLLPSGAAPDSTPKEGPPMAHFPTPPDAAWEDVSIQFRDGHAVSVKARDVKGVFNYTEMGMVDRKSGNPTVQWQLLRAFANGHGLLDWASREANRKNQKRREKLARNLRAFFRIAGDPFTLMDGGKGWRTRFAIGPEE